MKYAKSIEAENTMICLKDEYDIEFFKGGIDRKGAVKVKHLLDDEGEPIVLDCTFETLARFEDWCNNLIEIIETVKKEMLQIAPGEPKRKQKPKGKPKKK